MTMLWYYSTRPRENPEREECRTAAEALLKIRDLDDAIAQRIHLTFRPAEQTWVAAREAHRIASGAADTAREWSASADEIFDATFRDWKYTVKDKNGKVKVKGIKGLLGGILPSRFLNLPYREEVTVAKDMFARLSTQPSLAGNPVMLASFRTAYETLAQRVAEQEVLERTESEAALAFAQATRAFDNAWGILVRTVNQSKGKEVALKKLPVFRRSRTIKKGQPKDKPPEPSEPTPPEPSEPEPPEEPELDETEACKLEAEPEPPESEVPQRCSRRGVASSHASLLARAKVGGPRGSNAKHGSRASHGHRCGRRSVAAESSLSPATSDVRAALSSRPRRSSASALEVLRSSP